MEDKNSEKLEAFSQDLIEFGALNRLIARNDNTDEEDASYREQRYVLRCRLCNAHKSALNVKEEM